MTMPVLEKAFAQIDQVHAESRARISGNAPFIARCETIRAAHSGKITGHGMSGAAQMFSHILGAGVNKKLAAECLMACRENRTRDGENCRRAARRYLAEAAMYRRAFVKQAKAEWDAGAFDRYIAKLPTPKSPIPHSELKATLREAYALLGDTEAKP